MNKKILAVAIASVMGVAGCGGGDDSSSSDTSASSSSFSGTVNKGIVSNGSVEICDAFDDTGCIEADSSFYQTTTTNDSGSYDVTGAPLNTPIMVIVSKIDANTTMKCDLSVCDATDETANTADDAAFGESFEVPDSWTLKTIIPSATEGTTTVNVTSLTDIAAEEAIEAGGSSGVTEAIVTNANKAIQEAFGITTSITETGGVDLTDPEALSEASAEEIAAATYSASLLDATDEEKDALVTLDSEGGYTVDTTDVDAVLNESATLMTTVQDEANEALPEDEQIDLTEAVQLVDAVEPPEEVDPTPPENNDEIVAAKTFISDVRTAYNSVQDEGDLATGLDDFSTELEAFDELVSDDSEVIVENIGLGLEAIAEAFEEAAADATTYTAENTLVVAISGNTYTVDDDSRGLDIVATATTFETQETENDNGQCESYTVGQTCEEDGTFTADVNLALTTLVGTTGNTTLSGTGTAVLTGFMNEWTYEHSVVALEGGARYTWSETEQFDLTELSVALTQADLDYVSGDDNVSFDGELSISLAGLSYDESGSDSNEFSNDGTGESTQEQEVFTATAMGLMLDGSISVNDSSVGAYLDFSIANPRGYVHTYEFSDAWSCVQDDCTNTYEESETEETAENFVNAYLTARVTTDLMDAENNAMAASVELQATRETYDTVEASLTIDYNGVDTILEADISLHEEEVNPELTIRNTSGVVATVIEGSNDELSGNVKVGGVQAASIEETNDGLVLIRYTDGTFESLF